MISDYLLSFFSNLAGKNWTSYLTVTQSKFRLRAQILQTKDFISYELQNVLVFVLKTIGCIVKLWKCYIHIWGCDVNISTQKNQSSS